MHANNINIYNNLIKLTRNKLLYINLTDNETFSDRIVFLLFHLSFFLRAYKKSTSKIVLQEIHDFFFKQVELSIREIGYGDVSINKYMKKYINFFYDIVSNIDEWHLKNNHQKTDILIKFINNPKNISYFVEYFDKLSNFYKNNTLNYFTKDIEEIKI